MNFENMLEKHSFTLPSSKKTLILRPILVKEEKILMMKKFDETKEFIHALLQIIENCTMNKDEIKWKELSYNDFVFAFVKLRQISRDENLDMLVKCSNKECKNNTEKIWKTFLIKDIVKINNENKKYSKIIKINDNYSIQLREMSLDFVFKIHEELKDKDAFLQNIEMVIDHTEAVITEKEKITDKEKIREFIELLKFEKLLDIYKWFDNEPSIKLIMSWKCECGTENVSEEVDIINFLDIY
jgi:sulfur relay (sulfurtransferase) DsrC/TusE family protein